MDRGSIRDLCLLQRNGQKSGFYPPSQVVLILTCRSGPQAPMMALLSKDCKGSCCFSISAGLVGD